MHNIDAAIYCLIIMCWPPQPVTMIPSVILFFPPKTKTQCLLLHIVLLFTSGVTIVFAAFLYHQIYTSIYSFFVKGMFFVFISFLLLYPFGVYAILKPFAILNPEQQNRELSCAQPTPRINLLSTAMVEAERNTSTALLFTQPQCEPLVRHESSTVANVDASNARCAPHASANEVQPQLRHASSARTRALIGDPSTLEHAGSAPAAYADAPPTYADAVSQARCTPVALASDDNDPPSYADAVQKQRHIVHISENQC